MPAEVIGVARDITYYTPGESPMPYVYFPPTPATAAGSLTFHVRTSAWDRSLPRLLVREVRALDPRVLASAMTYDERRQATLYPQRIMSTIAVAFGALVLVLATVGLAAVVSYVVSTRTREFAVRLALGAAPAELVRGVLRLGLLWSSAGLAAGALLSWSMGRLLRDFLVGVSPADPSAFALGAGVLIGAAILAAWLPARRLAAIDPSVTLRH
jgi:predicted lysophospholipase L1 biosynthesis ABC-type transport system permease subunit